jgi:unsaturated chondroitin disaccharide hydrolase
MMENIKDEGIKHPEQYIHTPELTKAFCEQAIQYILKKIDANLEPFAYKFPAPASCNNVYPAMDNTDWTASFWTGMLWLAYEVTGVEKYRQVAEIHLESFKKRLQEQIAIDTHDLGFLYTLSCVAAYKLTGNAEAKTTALNAADALIIRYFDKAGIIQAWGDLNDPAQRGRMIVDCLMNLPLLYWATQVTGDNVYYDIAYTHAQQTAQYLVREDTSTFHTFYMDVETGAPKYGKTAQGYADDSCWARGQAWAIYGFPLSYRYTRDWQFMELSQKLANYFLNRLPMDGICYWDLSFTAGDEERDSSAAAIAACGLLELARYLPLSNPQKHLYEQAAINIVRALAEGYTTVTCPSSNGILLHAVYSKPSNAGVDECCIWGDYYYFEAMVRLM